MDTMDMINTNDSTNDMINTMDTMDANDSTNDSTNIHSLSNKWNLWAHLPHSNEWKHIDGYTQISPFTTTEETIAITESLPDELIKNCMLFVSKDGILPMYEDPKNKQGGYFSYKITNPFVPQVWKDMTYALVNRTISENALFYDKITGITISPKKNFCIIKIWMETCEFQNPLMVTSSIPHISPRGCLFTSHNNRIV